VAEARSGVDLTVNLRADGSGWYSYCVRYRGWKG
jgi:hypothetical protein